MHTASSLNTTPLRLFGHTAHTRAESPISCAGGVPPPHSNHAHPLHTSYPAPWSSRYTGIHCLMASPSYITTSSYFFLIVMTKIWIVFSRHICIYTSIVFGYLTMWLCNLAQVDYQNSKLHKHVKLIYISESWSTWRSMLCLRLPPEESDYWIRITNS